MAAFKYTTELLLVPEIKRVSVYINTQNHRVIYLAVMKQNMCTKRGHGFITLTFEQKDAVDFEKG